MRGGTLGAFAGSIGLLLPKVQSLADYEPIYRRTEVWTPAMREICRRHDLDASTLALAPEGTHVVFRVGTEQYIKLFAPPFASDHLPERILLERLASQLALPTPDLLAEGEIEDWPYLVFHSVPGEPLNRVWDSLATRARVQLATRIGTLMAELHALSTDGLEPLATSWPELVSRRARECAEPDGRLAAGTDAAWLRDVRAFLAALPPLFEPGFRPVLLHADLTADHLFVRVSSGRAPELSGLIDFGDAMLGHPLYEFVAPSFIVRDSPTLLRAMLLAYGFPEAELDQGLTRRLMGYTLLHRWASLRDYIDVFGARPPGDLAELEARLWTLPFEPTAPNARS